MYVYVLREEVPYEEYDWMEIVKDDEFAIYKIKKILINNINTDIDKNNKELKSLEEYIESLSNEPTNDIKYFKRQVEKALEKLSTSLSDVNSVKNANEFGFYHKRHNTLIVEKVKVT